MPARAVIIRRLLFVTILCLAAFLRFWNLAQNGWGNLYYAAAVRSMRGSLANFVFASYDPAGFLSVDKPPVALWVQTLSSFLFGYHGIALLLPEALAGVLSVALLYRLVKHDFGDAAGLVAGLFLALTPITVATDRMNLPDGLLTLTLLCASGMLLRAIRSKGEAEPARYPLLLCALLLGIGFNIKMWEALILAPAFALVFLCFAPYSRQQRMLLLGVSGILLIATAFSWVLFVDCVPSTQRPYVGGSRNNSAVDLILVYNGWERLTGGKEQLSGKLLEPGGALENLGKMPGFYAGPPGPFRLIGQALGPQVMWWFGLCLVGAVLFVRRLHELSQDQRASLALWGGWLIAFGMVFSTAGGTVHPYYISVLAPSVAALGGIAFGAAWRHRKERPGYLVTGLTIAALFQGFLLRDYVASFPILLVGPALALAAGLATLWRRGAPYYASLSLLGLCLCPLYWSWTAVVVPGNGLTPATGPEIAAGGWQYPSPQMPEAFTEKLITFLQGQRGKEKFMLATGGVYNASPIIVKTGQPIMALGGFLGSDPITTPERFAGWAQRRDVRFFLTSPSDGLPENTYLPPLFAWANDHCQRVDPQLWMAYQPGYGMEYMNLYDCR